MRKSASSIRILSTEKTEENVDVRLAFWVQAGFRIPNSFHFTITTKTKAASRRFLVSLFSVTLLAFSSSAVPGQTTTQISGTFAPSGNYSVNGNLFLTRRATIQCNVGPQQSDKVEVSGVVVLDGRLVVTMTGRFTRDGPARYTLLQARGGRTGAFSFVSIKWETIQGISARITYDSNHVYLEIAFEPGGFPPPLDAQRPNEITPTPATISEARRADKPSSTANMVLRPTIAGLTFADRVAYQYAIEDIYWRHRVWPKENPARKPSLEAIISQRQIEKKVKDYLTKSQAVADQRGWAISTSELQAEMDRMASHTHQPGVLRELFEGLGNDPFVVAECLSRPIVVQQLANEIIVGPGVSPAKGKLLAADTAASTASMSTYRLPEIVDDCNDDTWTASTTANAPDARELHTAVWTGSEMIVWGGFNTSPPYFLNTGGTYNPATDSWTAMSGANAPTGRDFHATVWSGSEMIVWGGYNLTCDLNTGGRYNPTSDAWTPTSTVNAPLARESHTAVWTGSEMIVWGGVGCCSSCRLNTGGRYDPATDSWTATSTINAPEARWLHTVEWTGSEMIVWGGTNQTIYLNTGGRYNPNADSWTPIGLANAPLGRVGHTTIWSGREMTVWGGADSTFNDCNTGGRYDASTDSWILTTTVDAPSPRIDHTAVWTGSEMIVWGGYCCGPPIDFDTGGRYSPSADSWIPTSTADAPHARDSNTAIWTGSEMIVWGGGYYATYPPYPFIYLNTGARYCAQSEATPTPTPTITPTATPPLRPRPVPRVLPSPAPRP